ncbi:MAG: lipid A deacylase LpxR family protein [Flavobacterium sp.]
MRKIYLFSLVFFNVAAYAQKPSEIGLITDNDLYTSIENDQYYTNGIELYYRWLGNHKSTRVAKRITEFRIGQYIYNPQSTNAGDINVNDRPFAGYLFAEAGINKFFLNEDVLKMNFQAGMLGPEAKGEEVQEGLHNLFGYKGVHGWEYQIKSALGLQANVLYSKKILGGQFKEKVDFHAWGEINAGTIWMGASAGITARVSLKNLLTPMYDSALHGAALFREKEKYQQSELFLYFSPAINYQEYDATIQGNRFKDASINPVTFPIVPWRFNGEVGVKWRKQNWNLSYSVIYRGKELYNRVITGYYYGSINIGYFL